MQRNVAIPSGYSSSEEYAEAYLCYKANACRALRDVHPERSGISPIGTDFRSQSDRKGRPTIQRIACQARVYSRTTFVVALVGRCKFAPMELSPLLPSLLHRQRRRENMKDGYLLGYTLAYTSGTL